MYRTNDNWERLVAAVIKRQQLWELFHDDSRSPSVLSEASGLSFSSSFDDESHDFSVPGGSSKSSNVPGLVFVSDLQPVFDHEDLSGALFQPLGKGNFGFSYLAKLHDGITVVVKVFERVHISEQEFKKNMEVVGNIKHENVAKLMAYYYSQEEKLMIYDHHSTLSVSALVHGKIGENRAISYVPWDLRLRIAIGVARGISHIHTQCGGKLVHGNIKASNIFLNSQRYGLVSDLGLASMIPITIPQASRCYAPEVKSTQDVSQASDVYSFGILLLELVTGKSPDPFPGHEAVDIVKLVNSVSPMEWYTKVFDGDLSLNPNIWEQIVRLLTIGISCVAKSPKKRPKISAVAKMVEDIGIKSAGDPVSIQTERHMLVFRGGGYHCPTFELEDLLFASYNVLEKGTFGTSYKAILGDENVILVKRLKDVIVRYEEFRQHMEVVGRMGHENVIELRAFYYFPDEQLMVYDYYQDGSLSDMLHGNKNSFRVALPWGMRLAIALGAARGIAHIHTKKEQKLVHGNIRASNIFQNRQKYGTVSDVGLAELTSIVTRDDGYSAPEVTDHKGVSQASDVYSFGVVLLELLSGKPSQIVYNGEDMPLVRWTQTALREERTDEVFDPELLKYEKVKEKMERMLEKAMYCVAHAPDKRPYMADVVKMLEEIKGLTFH